VDGAARPRPPTFILDGRSLTRVRGWIRKRALASRKRGAVREKEGGEPMVLNPAMALGNSRARRATSNQTWVLRTDLR